MKDTIYRRDAIQALVDTEEIKGFAYRILEDRLMEIPSVDRPQGEWTNAGVLTVRCSNCKSEFHELEAMNFCPNCGARMKGADDEIF